jgi:hypothetical protein
MRRKLKHFKGDSPICGIVTMAASGPCPPDLIVECSPGQFTANTGESNEVERTQVSNPLKSVFLSGSPL